MSQQPDREIQALIDRMTALYHDQRAQETLCAIEELEQLSQARGSALGKAAARSYLASYLYMVQQKEEALRVALDTIQYAHSHKISVYEVRAHSVCGIIYEDLSDYGSSLDHYMAGFYLSIRTGQESRAPYFLVDIGNLFMILDDFDTALPYLLRGFDGFMQIPALSGADKKNIPIVVLNIIEAYTGSKQYDEAARWAQEQSEVLKERRYAGIADCFLCMGAARRHYESGDTAAALLALSQFFDQAGQPDNFNDYYTINLYLNALDLAIALGERALSEQALEALDRAKEKTVLYAFDYKLEELRVSYYDRFLSEDPAYLQAAAYFGPYRRAARATIQELNRTYTNHLNLRTTLSRLEDEQKSILNANHALKKSAELDPFTGIYNKASLQPQVEKRLKRQRAGCVSALLLLDIDRFKDVNDTYGHQTGDTVIQALADLLKEMSPRNDMAGRLGGDEFLVYLSNYPDIQALRQRAGELLSRVEKIPLPYLPAGGITISIGICPVTGSEPYEDLLAKADHALYAAKSNGRARYSIFE